MFREWQNLCWKRFTIVNSQEMIEAYGSDEPHFADSTHFEHRDSEDSLSAGVVEDLDTNNDNITTGQAGKH